MKKILKEKVKWVAKWGGLAVIAAALLVLGKLHVDRWTYLKWDDRVSDSEVLRLDSMETIVLSGPVANAYARPGANQIDLRVAVKAAQDIVASGAKNVNFIIDSPGGSWDIHSKVFLEYLDFMKDRGIRSTCVVSGMAASMAAIILSHCDSRFATANSTILWHSVRVTSMQNCSMNVQETSKLFAAMEIMNSELWDRLKWFFWPSYFIKHFDAESFLPAREIERVSFGFIRVVNSVELE